VISRTLRVKFTELGYTAESLSLKKLETLAEKYERVQVLVEQEKKKAKMSERGSFEQKRPDRMSRDDRENRDWRNKGQTSKSEKPSYTNTRTAEKEKAPAKETSQVQSKGDNSAVRKAERDRKNRLRAEGKCFECESPEHLSRDCPTKKTVKASAARAVQIDFNEIERLYWPLGQGNGRARATT